MNTTSGAAARRSARHVLLRDIAVLQVKLVVDGFRDLLLVPASLVAGFVSLVRGGDRTGEEFYGLLRLGRASERYINLFGALDHYQGDPGAADREDMDRMVSRVEKFVVDEYRHGHLSAQAREQLERAVERLRQAASRHEASGDDPPPPPQEPPP